MKNSNTAAKLMLQTQDKTQSKPQLVVTGYIDLNHKIEHVRVSKSCNS